MPVILTVSECENFAIKKKNMVFATVQNGNKEQYDR